MLATTEVFPLGRYLIAYSLVLTAALAFVLGREFSSKPTQLEGKGLRAMVPSIPSPIQGRKPPSRSRNGTVKKKETGLGGETEAELLPYESGSGSAAQGNGIIAVTGSYGVGTSVIYVIDTNHKQLAVYEARGGSKGGRRLYLVGARRIDLDLKLEGYHDESEYSYPKLRAQFEKHGFFAEEAGTEDGGSSTETKK